MKKQNYYEMEKATEKKYDKKDKRKQQKMKVSGANVKEIAKIIKDK